jgi:hypothetical protein
MGLETYSPDIAIIKCSETIDPNYDAIAPYK